MTASAPASVPLVEIDSVSKTYRNARAPALCEINLAVEEGSFFGLLGPNGAGKTTLISILCGILAPSNGAVRVRTPWGEIADARRARSIVGLVPQELAFYPTLTVQENLRYVGELHGLQGTRLWEGIARSLAVGQLEAVCDQRAEHLSGGLKRRLNLALGVVHSPRLLVLDEPTAGVDAQSRHFLQDELRRLNSGGTTIVYTSHYLEEVEQLCDTLAVIDHGRVLAAGALGDLLRQDVVMLRLAAGASPALLARLARIPGAIAIRQDAGMIALVTETPQRTLTAALELLQRESVKVTEVQLGTRSLEGLFFQLTGTRLRDTGEERDAA